MNKLGKTIKKYRLKKGITQAELSKLVCTSRNTIENYESGRSQPNIYMTYDIAEALDLKIWDFVREVFAE